MTMVEPGATINSPGTGDISEPAPTGGGISSWSQRKKLTVFGIGGVVVAAGVFIYARKKSAASTASSTTSSNSTTPSLVLPSSNQDSVNGADYASLQEGLGNLSNQVSQLGTATTTPTTTGVSTPTQPTTSAPNVPPSLLAGIPGQSVVSEQFDPAYNDWIVLTNKGGIFNLTSSGQAGPGYYGNPLADPNKDNWVGANGQFIRTAQQLIVRPSGGYMIVDTAGEDYNYGPS